MNYHYYFYCSLSTDVTLNELMSIGNLMLISYQLRNIYALLLLCRMKSSTSAYILTEKAILSSSTTRAALRSAMLILRY